MSTSKMLTLMDMPNEILVKIIAELQNKSWEGYPFHCDPASTTALQNLRPVCKRLNPAGASVLFQNMINDEELYFSEDGFRLRDFALKYPHLASQVRRLQWKTQPNYEGAERFAQGVKSMINEETDSTEADLAEEMLSLLLKPYQGQIWRTNNPSTIPRTQQEIDVPLSHETLSHYTKQILNLLREEEDIDVMNVMDFHHRSMSMMESFNLENLCAHVRDKSLPNIISLELLDNSLTLAKSLRWRNLLHLQHISILN
ncbi:MAG: hypothetical protein Q9191_006907 [Dirinaria sp. TL-2023a]